MEITAISFYLSLPRGWDGYIHVNIKTYVKLLKTVSDTRIRDT